MKILISSIGSRGDVQPIVALALELRALGHDPRLCVAPNFKDWLESFGLVCVPIGPDLKKLTGGSPPSVAPSLSDEQRRQFAAQAIRTQFPVMNEAARGCDLIVAAGALQFTTRSVAELLGIPCVYAAYCPVTLPSPDHPPPRIGSSDSPPSPDESNRSLWKKDARRWNGLFREPLNEERVKAGLAPIKTNVQRYIFTDRPWLAADPTLAPAPSGTRMRIVQTGAWILRDPTPLPDELEKFLAEGEPPIYLGFGSMRASEHTGRLLLDAARAVRRRAIVSQGWANLRPLDTGTDWISIDDVSHERLFARVAAVLHHGGAGTTTTAAVAGRPQAIVPHDYDQPYWAQRVETLGVGVALPGPKNLTVDAVASALRACLQPEMAARAESLAKRIERNGARIAAQRLVDEFR
jgi:vancomycin aglycone glucosyltransferase